MKKKEFLSPDENDNGNGDSDIDENTNEEDDDIIDITKDDPPDSRETQED